MMVRRLREADTPSFGGKQFSQKKINSRAWSSVHLLVLLPNERNKLLGTMRLQMRVQLLTRGPREEPRDKERRETRETRISFGLAVARIPN